PPGENERVIGAITTRLDSCNAPIWKGLNKAWTGMGALHGRGVYDVDNMERAPRWVALLIWVIKG
ncbi:hypothetical protein, partial [Klebsiella pneumoniae]|uniref:hypothetical protein n=1 Tax=Klebsiella pneumoniae TaxID=573 RepID=UPI0030083E31